MLNFLAKMRGFSMVELLIGIALGGGLAAGVASLMQGAFSGMKLLQDKNNLAALLAGAEASLTNSTVCLASLKNGKATPGVPRFSPTLSIPADEQLYAIDITGVKNFAPGQQLGGYTISSVTLTEATPSARLPVTASETRYFGKVAIEFSRKLGNSLSPVKTEEFFMYVKTDTDSTNAVADGTITGCVLATAITVPGAAVPINMYKHTINNPVIDIVGVVDYPIRCSTRDAASYCSYQGMVYVSHTCGSALTPGTLFAVVLPTLSFTWTAVYVPNSDTSNSPYYTDTMAALGNKSVNQVVCAWSDPSPPVACNPASGQVWCAR